MRINLLLVSFSLLAAVNLSAQSTTASEAALQFINTLSPDELKRTAYELNDSLRLKWSNLPVGMSSRPGIQYGSLSDKSRMEFHRLLSATLSSQGYLKTTSIMQLDDILNTLYQQAFDKKEITAEEFAAIGNLKWGHGNYYISIFGKPGLKTAWGFNFGGHHIALNFTSDGKNSSLSPFFIGTDPSEIKSSKYAGLRILSKEEDYGFMLINSLTNEQQIKAIINQSVPKDIITNPRSSQRITEYYGIAGKDLDKNQKDILKILINEYIHNFEHQKAHLLIDKILASGIEKIYFAWTGSLERNKPHYYIVNGPDFLIEYDNVGFQNDGNHIHTILREKGNDFGEDLLKQHYQNSRH